MVVSRKITKIVAARCHILRLKCTKFDFGWGPAPDPAWRAYSAPQYPKPPSWISGVSFQEEGGKGKKGKVEGGIHLPNGCLKLGSTTNAACEQLNCIQFDQLILRKIIKIVATRCHILRLKCTQFEFDWGSAQTPLGELTALPASPRPPSWI